MTTFTIPHRPRRQRPDDRPGCRLGLSRLGLIALALGILLGGVCGNSSTAQETDEPPREVERERTLYVPYEKLQEIFEKEGRGIFLPYEEFLRLWREAQPKPVEPTPDEPPADAVIRGGLYTGSVVGEVARFEVTFDIDAIKKGWSELPLPLKGVAVESIELSRSDALFSAKGDAYSVYLPAPGSYQAKLKFSVRVKQEPGKKTIAFGVPPVAISRVALTIPEADVRVDVQPMLAVTQTTTEESATRVLAFLGNSSDVTLSWMPPAGKLAEGGAILLAEQSIRVALGERILKISTDVDYKVVRGEVDTLEVQVPAETRLFSVKGDNIREWTQEADQLVVKLHSAMKGSGGDVGASYRLNLVFERILQDTPETLAVPFPVVQGVIRESGWVVFGHDSGLNVRVAETTGLSQLDRDEVPQPLQAQLGVGFRYLAQPIALQLEIEKIIPVIKSLATSVVSLGEEEDEWQGWIDYEIEKAGVFRREIEIPGRWSVASMGDPSTVEDFQTEELPDGRKKVTVNLKSKAIGKFRLAFRLTAPGTAGTDQAVLSPPVVLDTRQDRGLFGVSAPKAINLTTVTREKMTSADVDELFRSGILNQLGTDVGIPLTYGYREAGSSVTVKLEPKQTEIHVLAQHLVEIDEGTLRYTHILDFEILYAAVDRLSFTAPTSLDEILKIESKEKKEVKRVSTANERTVWEMTFQAPRLGAVSITLTHELEFMALEPGKQVTYEVPLVLASGASVRQSVGFVAVRKEGTTLEVTPQATSMEAIEAGDLPDKLRRGQIYSAYRYFAADPKLSLGLTKYAYQDLATTVVNLLRVKAALSEDSTLHTKLTLFLQNTERQYLEIPFSPGTKILSVKVADKRQTPRKRPGDADTCLIQIPSSAGPSGTFPVVIDFEEKLEQGILGSFGTLALKTPSIVDGVPVTKIELELYLPPEYAYMAWGGNLTPKFPSDRPGLWNRFKGLLNEAIGAENSRTPVTSQGGRTITEAPPETGTIEVNVPTEGLVRHDFETLASVGALSFVYVDRTLFSVVDFLAFAAAMTVAYIILRHTRWRKSTGIFVIVFVPLVLIWFSRGAVVEVFSSMFAGGVLVLVLLLGSLLYRKLQDFRASRLSMAPDPYLEEAEPSPPKEEEGAADAPAAPTDEAGADSASSSEPPEKPSDEGDESQEGRS